MSVALPAIVAVPELSFAELDRRLEAAGWLLGAESQEPPLEPGEPHWCEFWRRDADVQLTYTFNPVVGLRVLALAGPDAPEARDAVLQTIPHLDGAALRALLARDDERSRLLGLLAAAATHDASVLDRVRALEADAVPRVAEAARRARDEILPAPLAEALETLLAAKRRHPDRSVLFTYGGGPEDRRQILRWLIHDFEASNPSIDQVLRSALADADPEVRITAVLAATRLAAATVAGEVAAAALPESTSDGADPRERRLYARLREAAVKHLYLHADRTLPAIPHDGLPRLHQLLSGPVPVIDDMTLLVHALTTPVDRGELSLPAPGMVADGTSFKLERSGLALAAVAAIPHWIGHAGREVTLPNPLRQSTPARGFFIARTPLTTEPVTRAEAEEAIARLSQEAGVTLRLPTADEWEMAMRGPDGRLYPWGNNLAPTTLGAPSPWRVNAPNGPEWTADLIDGSPVIVGDDRPLPASLRRRATPETQATFRVVIDTA